MADFDVSLRFGIDFRKEEGRAVSGALDDIRKQLDQLGRQSGVRLQADALNDLERAAEKARRAYRGVGDAEDRLKRPDGTEALLRETRRLGAELDRNTSRTRELRSTVEGLKSARGAEAIAGDITRMRRASDQAESRLRVLGLAAKELGDAPGARKLREEMDRLGLAGEEARREIGLVDDEVRKLGRSTGAERLERDLKGAGREAGELERRLERVDRAGRRLGGSRGVGVGRAIESAADRSGIGMVAGVPAAFMGGTAVAVGAAAGGAIYGGTLSTRRAISVESAMASVKRAMKNPSPDQLAIIEGAIRTTSQETGQPIEEIAALVAEAAKSGTAYDGLLDVTRLGGRYAIAAEMSPAGAGKTLAELRNQFGLNTAGMTALADSINYVADNSNTTEAVIGDFVRKAGTEGASRFAPEDLVAFGAITGGVGQNPAEAGNAFGKTVQRLMNAPALRDRDMNRALGRLGFSARSVQKGMVDDPTSTMMSILEGLSKLEPAQRSMALEGIGGMEYGGKLGVLVDQLPALRQALSDSRSPEAQGSVDATFKIFNETSEQRIAQALASIGDLGSEIGKSFVPAVNDFAMWVSRLVGGWAEEMRDADAVDRALSAAEEGRPIDPVDRQRFAGRVSADRERRARTLRAVRRGKAAASEDVGTVVSDEIENLEGQIADLQAQLDGRSANLRELPGGVAPVDPAADNLRDEIMRLRMAIEDLRKGFEAAPKAEGISFEGGSGGARMWYANARTSSSGSGGARLWKASYGGENFSAGGSGTAAAYTGPASYGGTAPGDLSGSAIGPAPQMRARLMRDLVGSYALTPEQAAGIVGNLDHESGGFTSLQEKSPVAGRGGAGLPMWTGPRRRAFEKFAAANGLDPSSYEANWRFMTEGEPDEWNRALDAVRGQTSTDGAMRAFERTYERAGVKNYRSRGDRAAAALSAYQQAETHEAGVGRLAPLSYTNTGAIRSQKVTPELEEQIRRGVQAVYGDGYSVEVYSGGQPKKGSGLARIGSTRHDGGRAADLYVVGPDGKRVTGDQLARLGQHWAASGHGGVGLEMRGGGIHLDNHRDRAKHWNYANERGRYTAGQAAAMRDGLAGIPPAYADPDALDPARYAEDGWAKSGRPVPLPKARPERAPAARGATTTVHNYHGVDPQVMALRAQRRQRRDIAMAEARAMHDTAVPAA
ncbi:phage tail tape measure protein [Notoacmeibacter ruber]|uniref:Phage tail tape measure protein n=1 Tax=Notoacmeibacter ruber TaxID=2670375 RepID=A0A3L7JE15_9HYPH|nr:phage tail tape measure protein [Notoacmeibacter ruber]RLQ88926.1 phage tail tape measure protein [Notoacmeibacter ruber]